MPVMIVVLAGAQTGAFDHALVNCKERAAKASILGVVANWSP